VDNGIKGIKKRVKNDERWRYDINYFPLETFSACARSDYKKKGCIDNLSWFISTHPGECRDSIMN
jgi:hypothetical protein